MIKQYEIILNRHKRSGILVDTNILLLYFIGNFDRSLIPRFKRLKEFTIDDYDILESLLILFNKKIITTPNILSEINSLSCQLKDPAKTNYFEKFASEISLLDEHYIKSEKACKIKEFPKFGLTDSVIISLSIKKHLVLTVDFPLYNYLQKAGLDAINFNHIRLYGWQ